MARISYVDEHTHPTLAPLIQSIRDQRRGKLIPVYGLLLHSPEMAEAWMGFINAARWKTTLGARIREIVILRVAVLNTCGYVIDVHRSHFAAADGLLHEECDALLEAEVDAAHFADIERAVIAYVDALTRTAHVDASVFAAVRAVFDERRMVELSALIGAYNMHTRVMNALRIDPESSLPVESRHG